MLHIRTAPERACDRADELREWPAGRQEADYAKIWGGWYTGKVRNTGVETGTTDARRARADCHDAGVTSTTVTQWEQQKQSST